MICSAESGSPVWTLDWSRALMTDSSRPPRMTREYSISTTSVAVVYGFWFPRRAGFTPYPRPVGITLRRSCPDQAYLSVHGPPVAMVLCLSWFYVSRGSPPCA